MAAEAEAAREARAKVGSSNVANSQLVCASATSQARLKNPALKNVRAMFFLAAGTSVKRFCIAFSKFLHFEEERKFRNFLDVV